MADILSEFAQMIKECEYTTEQVAAAFYNLYGDEMITGDGFREYSGIELLNMLEEDCRQEIIDYLG